MPFSTYNIISPANIQTKYPTNGLSGITRRVKPTKDLVNILNINGDNAQKVRLNVSIFYVKTTYIRYIEIEFFSRFADMCRIDQEGVRISSCALLSKKCLRGLN